MSDILYEKLIYENEEKAYQVRLVVNEFREVHYIQLRKYFLTYEGEWQASKEGISMEACFENIYALLDGLFDICSKAEGREVIERYAAKLVEE